MRFNFNTIFYVQYRSEEISPTEGAQFSFGEASMLNGGYNQEREMGEA